MNPHNKALAIAVLVVVGAMIGTAVISFHEGKRAADRWWQKQPPKVERVVSTPIICFEESGIMRAVNSEDVGECVATASSITPSSPLCCRVLDPSSVSHDNNIDEWLKHSHPIRKSQRYHWYHMDAPHFYYKVPR